MEAVLNDRSTTVYCIDAEDDFCYGLQHNGLAVIRGSLGYRYAQALVRNIAHPPHECDVIVYNLRDPACYDASSWGPGLNDNYHCEVVKLERDDRQRLFHYKGKERKYSQYPVVSETQISRAWIGGSGSFDGTDVLKAVSQGGLPLVYFLNPTFLAHVSHYLPLWLQMTIDISPTVANEYDLLNLADRFSQSLSSIGRGNLEFARPINFRVDKVTSSNNASKIMLVKLALNRVGDVLAALVSYGKGHIFFLPPFQNEINGCVDLIKNVIPRFQEDLQRSAEKNRAEMEATIAATPLDSTTPDMIPLQAVRNTRDYIEKVVHEVNTCYRNGCFNASGAMIRRLVETLIIEIYETNGRAQEIQDNDGNFLKLQRLIGKVSSGSFVNISKNTKQFLKDAKALGDTAVHNRKVLLIKDHLDSEKVSLRVAISELVKHARF